MGPLPRMWGGLLACQNEKNYRVDSDGKTQVIGARAGGSDISSWTADDTVDE